MDTIAWGLVEKLMIAISEKDILEFLHWSCARGLGNRINDLIKENDCDSPLACQNHMCVNHLDENVEKYYDEAKSTVDEMEILKIWKFMISTKNKESLESEKDLRVFMALYYKTIHSSRGDARRNIPTKICSPELFDEKGSEKTQIDLLEWSYAQSVHNTMHGIVKRKGDDITSLEEMTQKHLGDVVRWETDEHDVLERWKLMVAPKSIDKDLMLTDLFKCIMSEHFFSHERKLTILKIIYLLLSQIKADLPMH